MRVRHVLSRSAALAAGVAGLVLAAPVAAQDAAAGKTKYQQTCAVCHGQNGMAGAPDTPHLAGQPLIYLQRQLKQYRDGSRKHEIMAVMAKPLSDAEIENISTWLSTIKVEATLP